MDNDQIWNNTLENLRLSLSKANFSTWFPSTFIIGIKVVDDIHQICEIGCPSSFIASTIENRYYSLIKIALDQTTGKKNDLVFSIKQALKNTSHTSTKETPLFETKTNNKPVIDQEYEELVENLRLRPDFTFDNFAVSTTNQMAYAAAQAVSQSLGKAYNPLFLYGGVGVGKTHLMQAIAHATITKNAKLKVIYCTGEEFTNDIINAIRKKTTDEFKKQYRTAKLLMVDDIQFIAGKETAQEEFFHTFNSIWKVGGQIVLTSDRPPEDIQKLEDRLRSRFEGGLIIDIQNPDFELRTAIVQIKAQQKGINLPMDVAQLMSGNITSVRKLEGFLTRVISESVTRNEAITPEMVSGLLGQEIEGQNNKKVVKPKEVAKAILSYYNLKTADITGDKRDKIIVVPRQILMYLLRNDLKLPLMDIGKSLGGRDHTTVMHGVEKITKMLPESENLRVDIARIRKQIYG